MANVMVLFGSGGHSSEMLMLIQNAKLARKLELAYLEKLVCVVSEDDKLIGEKISREFQTCEFKDKLDIVRLNRGRKVGQSYFTAIWTTILGIVSSIRCILQHKPSLCLTNGPAISVTIALAIRFSQAVTFGLLYKCDLIYVESFCRTQKLSLSGKLIYYLRLADKFYVQWTTLKDRYPRALYSGILV